jgi:hypothetical protein
MARQLLTLTQIAEETGISYATLRNYVEKYGDEIPSEGIGRQARYPRAALKVFQRLRRESKPGRKPGGASSTKTSVPQERNVRVPAADPLHSVREEWSSRIQEELVGIRVLVGDIAEQLKRAVESRVPARPEAVSEATAPQPEQPTPVGTVIDESAKTKTGVPADRTTGHPVRRQLPYQRGRGPGSKVPGKRGRRPE